MGRLNVGVIGCGAIAQAVHLPLLKGDPRVTVVAVAEADAARRDQAQAVVPGTRAFDDYNQLLADPNVQAVTICLPTAMHAPAAKAALAAKKHVYLEKPLATSIEEGDQVIAAWKAAGVAGMIGLNYRFNPLYARLKAMLAAGRIGKPLVARSIFSTPTPAHAMPDWKRSRQSGGGVLLDLATHHVDLARFFFDAEIASVRAITRTVKAQDDTATLELALTGGVVVQSFFSLASVQENSFEIIGETGKLSASLYTSLDATHTPALRGRGDRIREQVAKASLAWRWPYLLEKRKSPMHEPSFRVALQRFVSRCEGGPNIGPNFEDGYKALAVVVAAEESAKTGRVVSLSC